MYKYNNCIECINITIQRHTIGGMALKKIRLHPNHGILLSNTKKPTTDTHNNLDGLKGIILKEKKANFKGPICMILFLHNIYEILYYKDGNG